MRSLGMRSALLGAITICGLGLLQAAPAQADTFELTSCHLTGGCGTATSFGTVTLTQVGTSVDFDVALSAGNVFVQTGAGDDQLFKFNGAASVGDITNPVTVPANAVTGGLVGTTGSFNGDGTGSFSFGVACAIASNCNGGSGTDFSELTFTVTNATIAALTLANDKGNLFVADVLIGAIGKTGPIDVSALTAVPLPPAAMLFGSALVGLGLLGRRRRKVGADVLAQA